MSKPQLKKLLHRLERSQLEQMFLDAYSARNEIKEYFEFYLNPDVEKLSEKYSTAIARELSKSRQGRSKARISVIKRLIAEFSSFQPGFEAEIDLYYSTISNSLAAASSYYFSDTLINGIAALMARMLNIADRNFEADKALERLKELIDNEKNGTRYFRQLLRKELNSYHPS